MDTVADSLFALASRCFDGWTDPETGLSVLRIQPKNGADHLCDPADWAWMTVYHQRSCFFDGGRQMVLSVGNQHGRSHNGFGILDLRSGEIVRMLPPCQFGGVDLDSGIAAIMRLGEQRRASIYDLGADRELATMAGDGEWQVCDIHLTANPKTAIVASKIGHYTATNDGYCRGRLSVLTEAGGERIYESDACHCNHLQRNPVNPQQFSFNRWPMPRRPCEQVIHLGDLQGNVVPLTLAPDALRPGPMDGGQRDHYVWLPDGSAIASYLSPNTWTDNDHYQYGWHISVLNVETGDDVSVPYPEHRWGCHFNPSPDSRHLVSMGGPGFQYLYAIDIAGLAEGWNERVLFKPPPSDMSGFNGGPFHHPFVLPDQSGALVSAGWPGEDCGIYMVEWPADLG